VPEYDSRPAPGMPRAKGYSTHLAIAGIIIALGCPPAGALLGIISSVQAKQNGRSPLLGFVAIAVAVVSAIVGAVLLARR